MSEWLWTVRTDLAVMVAMLAALIANPHELIGFLADLLGVP